MATINIPNVEAQIGIPAQSAQDIAAPLGPLVLSSHPAGLTMDEVFAANQTIEAFTVVGFNAAGEIVPAVWNADPAVAVKAIGITTIRVVTPATGTKKGAGIYRGGNYNINRLIYGPSYDTFAKKLKAFEGAPTPTQIRVGVPRTYNP